MQFKYISDLHLYDSTSMNWRPEYVSLDYYAKSLIETWNSFTSNEETVLIVGDIGYNCPKTIDTLNELNGNKVLVIGNHDLTWGRELYTCGVFKSVHTFVKSNGIFVKHIPDGDRESNQYYIHGHHHRYDMPGMNSSLKRYAHDTYRLNCAADLVKNKPCTLQELILKKELMIEDCKARNLI